MKHCIRNFEGYVCGGPFFKPKIGDVWARTNIDMMIFQTENQARKICDTVPSWTLVYKVSARDICVEEKNMTAGKLWHTSEPTKLKVEALIYDSMLQPVRR